MRAFLDDLVTRIGFRVIAGPISARVASPDDHTGVSAIVILYESHAAIHTYANIRSAFLDVFACRSFSTDTVRDVLRTHFGTYQIVEEAYLPRGQHWSRDAQAELLRWRAAR